MAPGRKTLRLVFTVLCMVVFSFMMGYWFYKYGVEDRDIGVVDYIRLEELDEDFKVPIASICLRNPFLDQKLNDINENINSTTYLKYLEGDLFEEHYNGIDYDNVTTDLNEYFLVTRVVLRNESTAKNSSIWPDHKVLFNGFYTNIFLKCFELISNMENLRDVEELHFYYNVQKLISQWSQYATSPAIYFKIYYPGQFLIGDDPMLYLYPLFTSEKGVYFVVFVDEVEVLKGRPKRKKKCDENIEHYDKMIMKEHIKRKGCRDPYLNINDSSPLCDTKETLKTYPFAYKAPTILGIPDPCQRISKLRLNGITYYFTPYEPNEIWMVKIRYPKEMRIITQSKEVDIHSLIGNIGGYLGLFMGKLTTIFDHIRRNRNTCIMRFTKMINDHCLQHDILKVKGK